MNSDALQALATLLADIDQPSLPAGTLKIYIDPPASGNEPVTVEAYPTIVLHHEYYRETDVWYTRTVVDYERDWSIYIKIFLGEQDTPQMVMNRMAAPWYEPIADVLLANPTLNGTVRHFGAARETAAQAFISRTGWLEWYNEADDEIKPWWGVEFALRVTTEDEFEETF